MSLPMPNACLQVSDESLSDALRLRDLLRGAQASRSLDTVRPVLGEAYAIAAQLADRLEQFFALEYERRRNENAGAAKHIYTPAVTR